jgi:hypothetical protein
LAGEAGFAVFVAGVDTTPLDADSTACAVATDVRAQMPAIINASNIFRVSNFVLFIDESPR